MSRQVFVTLGVLAAVGLSVVGCSRFGKEQRAEWRGQAEAACIRSGAVKETQYVKIARALEGPGSCGADHPIKVSAFATSDAALAAAAQTALPAGFFTPRSGTLLTRLNQEGTLTCPMYSAVNRWLEQVVQPAALARFGQPVVELRTMGTYACRPMNNQRGARLSEHSFANAIDVGGFRLADGSIVTVLKGWNGGGLEEQNFLREVHAGACQHFATVLGPGVALHHDHLHMDLARHGRRGDRSICRPYPQPVAPANPGFPIDPAKPNTPVAELRDRALPPRGETYAYASPRVTAPAQTLPPGAVGQGSVGQAPLPAYRPAQLPPAPRNPAAERELEALRQAPPRTPYQPQRPVGEPVLLYGKGQGPFLPLQEHEIDPADLDETTGSVGE
jgi:hypothetical protein